MKKTVVILIVLLGVFSGEIQAAWDLELMAYSAIDNSLYKISGSPLQTTNIGTLQTPVTADMMALARATDASAYSIDRAANILYSIDLSDASTISSAQIDYDVIVYNRGLDVSPSGAIYEIFEDNELRIINPDNGTTTFVCNIDLPWMESLAFSPNGDLYGGTGAGELYEINILTGDITLIADTPIIDIDALTFAPDGYLYAADSEAARVSNLYRIDPLTGNTVDLGSTGLYGLNGLLAVPEPATLLLFSLGAVILRRKR